MMKITIELNGVTTVKQLTATELKAWEDRLLDPVDWVVKAIDGQTNHNMKKMSGREVSRLQQDPGTATMPATMEGLVESAVAQPGYKNRMTRDAEHAARDALAR